MVGILSLHYLYGHCLGTYATRWPSSRSKRGLSHHCFADDKPQASTIYTLTYSYNTASSHSGYVKARQQPGSAASRHTSTSRAGCGDVTSEADRSGGRPLVAAFIVAGGGAVRWKICMQACSLARRRWKS